MRKTGEALHLSRLACCLYGSEQELFTANALLKLIKLSLFSFLSFLGHDSAEWINQ
jgi:hypothetical protein